MESPLPKIYAFRTGTGRKISFDNCLNQGASATTATREMDDQVVCVVLMVRPTEFEPSFSCVVGLCIQI
jgi:hypothetical protein